MELLIAMLLSLVIAGLAFAWMRSRSAASGGALPGRRGGVRGRRRTAAAARHDPMADAVERHSAASDPREAAEAELRLQAQANRVASELHAQEAAALESQAGRGGLARSAPARADQPAAPHDGTLIDEDRPPHDGEHPRYLDEHGRPVYEDERPRS